MLFMASYTFGSYMVNNDHEGRYIWSDAEGYYMYLPAVFIHGSFEGLVTKTPNVFKEYPGTKKVFTKYTYGVALMEMPFFLMAYVSRIIQGLDPNLYHSSDYSVGLLLAGCFYGVLGLFLLFQSLKVFPVSRTMIWVALGVLLLGSNLLFYMTCAPGMSHAYSFFLFSAVVYLTPKLFDNPTFRNFALTELVIGLITIIRPTNAVVILYPLLYGVTSAGSLKNHFIFFKNQLNKMAAASLFVCLVWLPQLYYWKYITGKWILYSYSHESFIYWKNPKIMHVLFSYWNGFFTYSPVMLLPVIGLFFMLKKNCWNSVAILSIFILSTYIFGSWWCWWFGGAFGLRSYVEYLSLLVFPLLYILAKINSLKSFILQSSFYFAIGIMVYYTIFCTVIYDSSWSGYDWTADKYWSEVFCRAF